MGKGAGVNLAVNQSMVERNTVYSDENVNPFKRSFNFCAGPAMLDSSAMATMWRDFCSWQGSGVSLIEMSQREKDGPVQTLISDAVGNIRKLLSVPRNYKILLFQVLVYEPSAEANTYSGEKKHAQYVDGGFWSSRASAEGAKYCSVSTAAAAYECAHSGKLRYPDPSQWDVDESAAFLHIVSNETIQGLELGDVDVGGAVLCADMTSTLLSRPVDVSKYGVIYASGGKNLGPAGVCVVMVREDLLGRASSLVMNDHNNLYNTQCTFAIWAMKTITDGLLNQGGLKSVEQKVMKRAAQFYSIIDNSNGFYTNNVHPKYRSRTSVPFRVKGGDVQLEHAFCCEAEASGLHSLAGHHTVGGLRACLYNGIPDEALHSLCHFMVNFQDRHANER